MASLHSLPHLGPPDEAARPLLSSQQLACGGGICEFFARVQAYKVWARSEQEAAIGFIVVLRDDTPAEQARQAVDTLEEALAHVLHREVGVLVSFDPQLVPPGCVEVPLPRTGGVGGQLLP